MARNPEIGNTPVGVLPNKLRLGQVRDAKIGNKMLLNAAKFQGYNFYRFRDIKGKPPPTQIRFKNSIFSKNKVVQQVFRCAANESKYSRMDQVIFVENSISKTSREMLCLSRPYPFKFLKGCLPQILLGPLLNTLFHMFS